MEALYSKLYDKYTKLKSKKLSELDQLNKEQEVKFVNYLSAADELIEHLKKENEQLQSQLDEMRTEFASVRLARDKQVSEYQTRLMEQTKKNEILSEEVEKLLKLQHEGTRGDLNNKNEATTKDNSSSGRMTRKRTRQAALELENEGRSISSQNVDGSSVERESTQNLCNETASGKPPECGTKANDQSGVDVQGSGHCNWLIQALFEYALGMKLSTDIQTGRICLSALHQSSGYSFSLSWISKEPEEEAELLYHVLSLGTFERVAPEWMSEDIMFSPTMCPIFFERLSRVIKLNH